MAYTLGFKDLTTENWMEADEIMSSFVEPRSSGNVSPISSGSWAKAILSVRVSSLVPKEARGLIAVARGAMLYGYFFYPMYTLGSEQLFRAAETALGIRARELGCPSSKTRLVDQIDWLFENGALTADEKVLWHTTRKLRNSASHPEEQTILPPGQAFGVLKSTAWMLNNLFK